MENDQKRWKSNGFSPVNMEDAIRLPSWACQLLSYWLCKHEHCRDAKGHHNVEKVTFAESLRWVDAFIERNAETCIDFLVVCKNFIMSHGFSNPHYGLSRIKSLFRWQYCLLCGTGPLFELHYLTLNIDMAIKKE